jgi:NAD(P)-dependent dehydrogenase (short-subunit alcohol dehydrogenase family)
MGRSAQRRALQRAHFVGATAIVTGGASGIGRALATELSARGATVLVADIDLDGATRVADSLHGAGPGTAHAAEVDVTDAGAVQDLVSRFATDHDGIDFMFNNAGIGVGGEVSQLSMAHWRRVIDVNLLSVIHGVTAAYPGMIERGRGHIVNTASLSGLVPSPLLVPYSTTKHAVVGLSIGLRVEAAAAGVRVSVLCPGVIETPLLDRGNPDDLPRVDSMPDIRAMLTQLMGKPYPAESLAVDTLDAVALNRPIIVAPGRARAVWAAYRAWPGLLIDQSPRRLGAARGVGAMSPPGPHGPGPEHGGPGPH